MNRKETDHAPHYAARYQNHTDAAWYPITAEVPQMEGHIQVGATSE